MNNKPKKRQILIFPVVFAFFSFINLYLTNIDLVNSYELIFPIFIILLLFTMIWWVSYRITKNSSKTALITSIFFILFFSYGHILSASTNLLIRFTGIDLNPVLFNNISWKMNVLLVVWIAVFFLFAYFIIRIQSDFRLIIQFMNVASITLLILMIYQTTSKSISSQNFAREGAMSAKQVSLSESIHQKNSPVYPLPDTYYIIVDGYGSANILSEYFELDNNDFLSFLTGNNFYIADSSNSNYAHTVLSLSSSLNMQYLDDIVASVGKSSVNPVPLVQKIHSNRLINFLQDLGYSTVAFETGYRATELRGSDHFLAPEQSLSPFQSELINLTPFWFWLRNFQFDSQRERILYAFEHLPNTSEPDQPTFIFAHITCPHPPFVFGPNGERENPDMIYTTKDANFFTDIAGQDEYIRRYRNQVIYLNKLLVDTIEKILSHDGNAVIIIQGDHGPGSMLDWENIENSNIEERMSILNAYYFPDQDYSKLNENITPVNTFRVILDQYFGTDIGLIEDRSYFSLMSKPYDFIDVTEELNHGNK